MTGPLTDEEIDYHIGEKDPYHEARLWATIDQLRAEIAALTAAISCHRNNVWGNDTVGHDEDIELYAVLNTKSTARELMAKVWDNGANYVARLYDNHEDSFENPYRDEEDGT
jgi:hypothetical protein